MKKGNIIPVVVLLVLLAAGVFWLVANPLANADDPGPMGGANWDALGTEWQMYGQGRNDGNCGTYNESEIWTLYINGTETDAVVGPGFEDYCQSGIDSPCNSGEYYPCDTDGSGTYACRHTSDLYTGRIVYSEQLKRSHRSTCDMAAYDSPEDVWFDKETLTVAAMNQSPDYFEGSGYQRIWNTRFNGMVPSDRADLSLGQTWDYYVVHDQAHVGWADGGDNSSGLDAGDHQRHQEVTVTGTAIRSTVAGDFLTWEVRSQYTWCQKDGIHGCDALGSGDSYYSWWDIDGALACEVALLDEITPCCPQEAELWYHDWPDDPDTGPVVFTCDVAGNPKTSFAGTDTVYATGHWVTLHPSHDDSGTVTADNSDNLYDIWIGNGTPTEGATLSAWGTLKVSDINVGPQSGLKEPGTFDSADANLGTLSAATDWYFVLDDEDGIFHLDSQTHELEGASWGTHTPATGTTEWDDGLFGPFTVGPAPVDVDIYVNLQGENRPVEGWEIPLEVCFCPAGSGTDTLLNPGTTCDCYSGTSTCAITDSGTRAMLPVGPVNPGTYDITADSETTLMNVKRSVHVP